MPDDPPARVFNGRYRVERQLARGGMAEVYVGQDLVLHRAVTLKVLARDLSRDEGFVDRFRREARAVASLSHPNVVAIYDWGETEGSYFIVMEYVAGQSLAQLLRAEGPLPAERTAAIGAEIAAALSAAHAQGIVHRDVKPGNVLINEAGAVKVTDFGIAQVARTGATQLTQTGMVLGTAAYLSPEQVEGRPTDARSDIYALGVVLYEMVVGRTPFHGDTALSVAYQHAREQPPSPRQLNPAVPLWLEAVILRSLEKDAGRRYADADALRDDLLSGAAGSTLANTLPLTTLMPGAGPTTTEPLAAQPLAPTAAPTRPYVAERAVGAVPRSRGAALAVGILIAVALVALGVYVAARGSTGPKAGLASTTTTAAAKKSKSGPSTSSTTAPTTTTSLATSFAGYSVVAGTGSSALYCPTGVALGASGPNGPSAGPGPAGGSGGSGQGGAAGCGSNGGGGGHGGNGAPGGAGGVGGGGGGGGCPPASLAQMRTGDVPCNGTGSDGGNGGNGGNGAPGGDGGAGGRGGNGGSAQMARGGNGGNGGNATPLGPGGPGSPGQAGGGADGTTAGMNGQNGLNGTSG